MTTAALARHEVDLLLAYRALRAACSRDDRAYVTRATIAHVNRTTRAMYSIKRRERVKAAASEQSTAA
jgi:hypothetical protein